MHCLCKMLYSFCQIFLHFCLHLLLGIFLSHNLNQTEIFLSKTHVTAISLMQLQVTWYDTKFMAMKVMREWFKSKGIKVCSPDLPVMSFGHLRHSNINWKAIVLKWKNSFKSLDILCGINNAEWNTQDAICALLLSVLEECACGHFCNFICLFFCCLVTSFYTAQYTTQTFECVIFTT